MKRKTFISFTILLPVFIFAGISINSIEKLLLGETIENFDDGVIELLSYPEEDQHPDAWTLDSTNTYNNSPYSLKLYGNTWKLEIIDSLQIDSADVWQVAAYIEQLGEIQGFGLMDSVHTLLYAFAGTQLLNIQHWVTVYQGAFALDTWNIYQLPVGEDWLAWFGYLPTITGIVFINDRDTDTSAVAYFDEIIDITNDLPIAPQVEIWDSVGEIFVNAQGEKSVTVQFHSLVIDPDSEHHDYFWYFGDDSTSNDSNPIHTYLIEDDHEYTVLLEVKDSTGLWGRATCQVIVDPGSTTFPVTMNFVGDIMLARRYELPGGVIDTLGVEGIFDPTLPYLGNAADITVANLESPFTEIGPRHPTKPIVFRGSPENVAGLVHAGIDIVSLANNHIIDYGLEGMRRTQEVLFENNILYSGAGANSYEAYLPIFQVKSGVNIGFLAFCNRTGQYDNYQPYLNAGFNKPGFAFLSLYDLSQQIQNIEASADLVVVEMHSGIEYSPIPPNISEDGDEFYSPLYLSPDSGDIEIRHHAIDEGADLVINHHPHMIQGFEVYNGKLIAHSLGDFTFDLNYPETYPTVILNAKINANGFYEYSVIPVYIDDYIPFRAQGEMGIHILDYLAQRSKELGTYLIVDRDSVVAQIVLDTLNLTPYTFSYSDRLEMQENYGYWKSNPLKLPRDGSISSIFNITPTRNWQVRLGRELTWFWSGNFEDEGSTLWLLNQSDEFYDTIAFQGERSLCQVRPFGTGSITTNLEERIVCYSDSIPYTLYGNIKTQNSDSAGIMVRYYRSRTSGYNGSNDLDTVITSISDWTFYYNEFTPTDGTQYFDILLHSAAPESSESFTWFDNVGIIEWEPWQSFDSIINIATPNDFYWIQIRTNETTNNAMLFYTETDYIQHVAISDIKNQKLGFKLFKIMPNPSRSNSVIQYNLLKIGKVNLKVYNTLGQEVKTLVNGIQAKGQKSIIWDGKDNQGKILGSGIYFCRLQTNNYEQSRKIILLK